MSWRDNLSEAEARLVVLEAAELKQIGGGRISEITYGGQTTKWSQGCSAEQLQRMIYETRLVIKRLSGGRSGGGITPVMLG